MVIALTYDFWKDIVILNENFEKCSRTEKKLTSLDRKVFSYCVKAEAMGIPVTVEDLAIELDRARITISSSLRRLKSVKAIDRDFKPTKKFFDKKILKEVGYKDVV